MKEKVAPKQRWARFRLQVIGPLLASPAASGELQGKIRELSERVYRHPLHPDKSMRLGFSTIERWYYQAKDVADPIAALSRKARSDAGRRGTLSDALLSLLAAQYAAHPRWTVQLHYDNLAAEVAEKPQLGVLPSYQSVRRRMRETGWLRRREPANPTEGQHRAARRRESREIRGFEASHVHALWHLDFHQGSLKVLDEEGRWHTPLVCAVLDDRSRVCCHLQWYLAESAQNLVHALMQAMLKRGLPRALMTDNGSAMLAEETREGLARLGVSHETTLPYSAYQNGKQEVFWAQLEGRLMELLRGVIPLRLDFLNRTSQAWVEQDYHRRPHSEIGCPPHRASARRSGGLPSGSRHGVAESRLYPSGHTHPAQKRRHSDGRGGALRGPLTVPAPAPSDTAPCGLGPEPADPGGPRPRQSPCSPAPPRQGAQRLRSPPHPGTDSGAAGQGKHLFR